MGLQIFLYQELAGLFLIVSFEKTCQKLGLRASSRIPNTCFSVFVTLDEALVLAFDILLENCPKGNVCQSARQHF